MDNAETQTQAARFLQQGFFKIQTPTQAHALASFLSEACPDPRSAIVGISELLLNAIEHGNLKIGFEEKTQLQKDNLWMKEIERRLSLPEHRHQYVQVEFKRTDTSITLIITDEGSGFDWERYENLDPKTLVGSHGRGILMARTLAFKSLTYSEKGNQVTCEIAL